MGWQRARDPERGDSPVDPTPRGSRGLTLDRRRRSRVPAVLGTLGALWGATGYAVLWGYTSIVVDRRFFVSPAGLVLLLPVRIVLWAIHVVEQDVAGHAFDFSRNHGWIGLVSAAVGATLLVVPYLVLRRLVVGRRPVR